MGQYMNKNTCSNCNNSIENKKYLYKFVDNKNKSLYFCGKCIFYGINNTNYSFSNGWDTYKFGTIKFSREPELFICFICKKELYFINQKFVESNEHGYLCYYCEKNNFTFNIHKLYKLY